MFKNALKSLTLNSKQKKEKELFIQKVGEYFYDRQYNESRNSEAIYNKVLAEAAINEVLCPGLNLEIDAAENAFQVIADFRLFEAKVKGWK